MKIARLLILLLSLATLVPGLKAQEREGMLRGNPALYYREQREMPAKKTTATATEPLSMPFFEDFTGYGIFPDSTRWTDYHVYINNTMAVNPVTRGVATFDALDWRGIPYDSFSNTSFRPADSLTSQPINLSLNVTSPADSIYLSFFYQPQGNGFYPLASDSLMLYLRTKFGGFIKVWSTEGTSLQPFKQVMIPIRDTLYFDSFFQFRFVNKGALYWADAVWNVDYVRLGTGRSMTDTTVNDIGFSGTPSQFLNDYTSMPYRQFFGFSSSERTAQMSAKIHNNYTSPQSANHAYSGKVLSFGTVLKSPTVSPSTVAAGAISTAIFPSYTSVIPLTTVGQYNKVTFRNEFFIESVSTSDPSDNDTVVRDVVFDNYLAYDDGTAEKSYYLDLYPTLPGKIAIEYHLNKPDTMQGMAIYFGRQVPFASYKMFDIKVYSALQGVYGAATDNVLYTEEFCEPAYLDTVNKFCIYKFSTPLLLAAGTFFAGTFQPAESGSDSLYFGLDVNRIGINHAYYNVLSSWVPSLISGAIMMRPLLGLPVQGTDVPEIADNKQNWRLYPNPASSEVRLEYEGDETAVFSITDMAGRKILTGELKQTRTIDISTLTPGVYFFRLSDGAQTIGIQKLTKH